MPVSSLLGVEKMKKCLLIAMMIVSLVGFGESGAWRTSIVGSDELTGTKRHQAYTYITSEGGIGVYIYPDGKARLQLGCSEYTFFDTDSKWDGYEFNHIGRANIGIYRDGKLIKKDVLTFRCASDERRFGYIFDTNYIQTICILMSEPGTSMRVVARRYGEPNLDITIPYNQDFQKMNCVKRALEQKEAKKREVEEAARQRIAEIESRRIAEEAARKEKEEKIAKLEEDYKKAKSSYEICVKNGYTHTMKKRKVEMERIKEELAKLKNS